MDITLAADERLYDINDNLKLIQKKGALAFGSDAYLLSAFLRRAPRTRALELGCGNGVISLLAATRGRFSHITAVEIQPEMAALTARNIALNGLGDRISVREADLRTLTPTALGGEVDAVFANPPYMRTDSGKGNLSCAKQIARHEVCGGIADFAACASRLLKYGGKFYCVYRPDRLSSLFAALRACGIEPKRMTFVHADSQTEPSMVLVCAVKGAAESMRITPPLLLHPDGIPKQSARPLSEAAQKIYDSMQFDGEW